MDWQLLIGQATVNGLVVGLLYLLMAVGFTLVFGVMRMVNFAHGEFYMLGAFTAYALVVKLSMPFALAVGLSVVIAIDPNTKENGCLQLLRGNQILYF